MNSDNKEVFISLVKTGLWEKEERLSSFEGVEWEEVYRLASEQSVLGLVLAGIELSNLKPPQELLLQWIGEVQMLEQQNKAMNQFIAKLIERLRNADIYTLLVKGQGIAQCYERPLWRACGDVDLLLSDSNYERAKVFLPPVADHVDPEDKELKHLGMTIDSWIVELHGTLRTQISSRINNGVDDVQNDLFYYGNVRSWLDGGTQVFLPDANNDAVIIFTHFIHHLFIGGVGIRQICDWCRLLYSYRDSLNYELLESRIKKMGLMSEWKAFGALAIEYLGFPKDSMPLLNVDVNRNANLKKKADRIMELVLESGNFGHNKDLSYRTRYSGITYKIVAAWRRLKDFASLIPVFPLDAPRFYVTYVMGKVKA